MSDISKNLEEIIKKLSKKDSELAFQNRFPYIFTKASYFIKQGPKLYSEKDALNMPNDTFTVDDLNLVKIGCNQLIKGIGLSKENPLKNIGIRGCHKLFKLFHFEFVSQMALKDTDGNFIDKMVFKHIMDKREITYYNLVTN